MSKIAKQKKAASRHKNDEFAYNNDPSMVPDDLFGDFPESLSLMTVEDRYTLSGYTFRVTGIETYSQEKEEWKLFGQFLAQIEHNRQWIIGDWIKESVKYGGTEAAAEILGLSVKTLYNYKTVCDKFEISRRREILSFSHHEVVSGMMQKQADELLDYCIYKDDGTHRDRVVSVSELRKIVKGSPALIDDTNDKYKIREIRKDIHVLLKVRPEVGQGQLQEREVEAHQKRIADIRQWLDDFEARLRDDM